jgi:DNA-binding IclR family transcriptional regulator
MTVRDRVLNALATAYPDGLSNRELSCKVGAPEASIRRATLALDYSRQITGGYMGTSKHLTWTLRPEPVSLVAGDSGSTEAAGL